MTSPQTNHCLRCGYNLHGNTSGKCPECGLGATVIVGVSDTQQFHRAQAALEREGLLVRVMAPGVGEVGAVYSYGNPSNTGWFWVDATQLDRVEACLDEVGVASWIGNLPIVDRSEPKCPKCDVKLDPNGPEQCPTCGTAFQWVEIEEPDLEPTGVLCPECGYELTGNTSGRCPECNAIVPEPTVDAVVEAAMRKLGADDSAESPSSSATHAYRTRMLFVVLATALLVDIGIVRLQNNWLDLAIAMVGVILIGAGLTFLVRRSTRRALEREGSPPHR